MEFAVILSKTGLVRTRIPLKGDYYIAKTGKALQCKEVNYSRRAKTKIILKKIK